MSKQEFEDTIANISSSFTLSKEKIGATGVIWKLLPRKLTQIVNKLVGGEPITEAELTEYRGILMSDDPLIDENGNPFVLYIHDFAEFRGRKPRRVFHVAWCQTLERMDNNGRRARYVKKGDITNSDFNVDYGDGKKGIEKLPACEMCRRKMQKIVEPTELYYSIEGLDMPKFFGLYGKQDLLDINNPMYPVDYPENWDQISRSLRERAGWKCSSCNKDCSNDKGQLHVHHKDGRRGVVHAGNLEVVCASCHSKKFGHAHMNSGLTKSKPLSVPVTSLSKNSISNSQMNKFESFMSHPERYATGSDKTKQKAKEARETFESIKDGLSEEKRLEYEGSFQVYSRALKNK